MSEGRIGNGVGLDTPASVVGILSMLRDEGYRVGADSRRWRRADADADRRRDQRSGRARHASRAAKPRARRLSRRTSTQLPADARQALNARWGPPEQDPTLAARPLHDRGLALRRRCSSAFSRRARANAAITRAITTPNSCRRMRISRSISGCARAVRHRRDRACRQARQSRMAAGQERRAVAVRAGPT